MGYGGQLMAGHETLSNTHIFANDFLQRVRQDLPWKHLDILLDVARLRIGELHDELEEVLAVGLAFGNGHRSETFEVAADAILLFHRESHGHQRLQ